MKLGEVIAQAFVVTWSMLRLVRAGCEADDVCHSHVTRRSLLQHTNKKLAEHGVEEDGVTTCSCTGHGNEFHCTNGSRRHCASNQECYAKAPFAYGHWGDGCRVQCSCTGHGNQFRCTDGSNLYCSSTEECYANKPFEYGHWGNGCRSTLWKPSCPNNCDETASIAARLTDAIASSTMKYGLHADVNSQNASMDCLEIFPDDSGDSTLLGIFHTGIGGEGHYRALYVARATLSRPGAVPGTGDWTVISALSRRASMGYPQRVPNSDRIILAYELENDNGNTVAIRLYENSTALKRNYYLREVQLSKTIKKGPGGEMVHAKNLGTPSIERITAHPDGGYRIDLLFHYYVTSDMAGFGSVHFPGSGSGIVSENFAWNTAFEDEVDLAIRSAGADGKIGQRANIIVPSRHYLLYEAQMAEAGEGYHGWLSWRLYLHQWGCKGKAAALLNLKMPMNLQTFANPHATIVGDWIYIGLFIPSEPFDKTKAESYANSNAEHGVRCSQCAAHPMKQAQPPASCGSALTSIRLSDVFP